MLSFQNNKDRTGDAENWYDFVTKYVLIESVWNKISD